TIPIEQNIGFLWVKHNPDTIEQQNAILSAYFPRKCRGLVDLDWWKASELRHFLLYKIFTSQRLQMPHTVYLFSQQYSDFLIDVYKVAVPKVAASFGSNHLVYNIQLFSHLVSFVKLYGCFIRFSCFLYKSELGHLNPYTHVPKPPVV
ncbi:hypothetical protein T265_14578, partial [Opisthorchis viverrini]